MPTTAVLLARRLRALRCHGWADVALTPAALAALLDSSPATIVAYEDQRDPVLPSVEHLAEYARLFRPPALAAGLDPLLVELLELRQTVVGTDRVRPPEPLDAWRLAGAGVLVCYLDPAAPGAVVSADTAPLMGILARLRRSNPGTLLSLRLASDLRRLNASDRDLHLVLTGPLAATEHRRLTGDSLPAAGEGEPIAGQSPFRPDRRLLLCTTDHFGVPISRGSLPVEPGFTLRAVPCVNRPSPGGCEDGRRQ